MKKYKIKIAYDGTNYQGFQQQPHKLTIADCLEKSFKRVFRKEIGITGASRTDAGVHALGQMAIFKTDLKIDAETILKVWQRELPLDIQIRSLEIADPNFHPMFNVEQKTYIYHLFQKRPIPFVARFGWHYDMIHKVDLEKFVNCMKLFEGEHDFRSFAKIENDLTTIRKINKVEVNVFKRYGVMQVKISANSFLRFQIRRMIGAALDVARRPKFSTDYINDMLKNPCSEQELLKADAAGLCLYRINYINKTLGKHNE